MDIKTGIYKRRAYRSLKPTIITDELINDLASSSQLAPSCFNNQPWQFIFVYDKKTLSSLHQALSSGNKWAESASMIIVVFSNKESDCLIHDREYYLFDTGLATAFLILRATELGLVAHPIAGYSPKKVKEILNIPTDLMVITLVMIGEHSDIINPVLSEKQKQYEKSRPERKLLKEFVYHNSYHPEIRH